MGIHRPVTRVVTLQVRQLCQRSPSFRNLTQAQTDTRMTRLIVRTPSELGDYTNILISNQTSNQTCLKTVEIGKRSGEKISQAQSKCLLRGLEPRQSGCPHVATAPSCFSAANAPHFRCPQSTDPDAAGCRSDILKLGPLREKGLGLQNCRLTCHHCHLICLARSQSIALNHNHGRLWEAAGHLDVWVLQELHDWSQDVRICQKSSWIFLPLPTHADSHHTPPWPTWLSHQSIHNTTIFQAKFLPLYACERSAK